MGDIEIKIKIEEQLLVGIDFKSKSKIASPVDRGRRCENEALLEDRIWYPISISKSKSKSPVKPQLTEQVFVD